MAVVAGGRNEIGVVLKSVEVILLSTKSVGMAQDMISPREHFNLIAVGTRLMAIGGVDATIMEVWHEPGEPWTEAPTSLTTLKSQLSVLVSSDLNCSAGPLPPHTCPTVGGGTCVFPFAHGWLITVSKTWNWGK